MHRVPKPVQQSQSEFEPDNPSSDSKTYLLIIQGSEDLAEKAMIGDFMGLVRAYQLRADFGGDFWTAMDPDKHLESLGRDSIKFDEGHHNVVTYTRFDQHREPFYVVVDPEDLKAKVLAWITDKAAVAKCDDVVTIIFIAHGGSGTGAIRLGTKMMSVKELERATAKFVQGVQVNLVTNSCYAGFFIDQFRAEGAPNRFIHAAAARHQVSTVDRISPSGRYRNTQFTRGFVESLGNITIPRSRVILKGTQRPTLQYHHDTVQARTNNPKRSDKYRHDAEVYYTEADTTWTNIMETILFRSFVDVAYDPTSTSRRRRITGYASLANSISPPDHPDPQVVSTCLSIVEQEVSRVSLDPPPHEVALSVRCRDDKNRRQFLPDILRQLWWRATKQMSIFQIFLIMVRHGLANIDALSIPVNYEGTSEMVDDVVNDLRCFPLLAELDGLPADSVFSMFDPPIVWLAVMLCRSTSNLNAAFSIMNHSKFFGEINMEAVESLNQKRSKGAMKAQSGSGKQNAVPLCHFRLDSSVCSGETNEPDCIGLLLPSGVSSPNETDIYCRFLDRFDPMELAFKLYFRVTEDDLKDAARAEFRQTREN